MSTIMMNVAGEEELSRAAKLLSGIGIDGGMERAVRVSMEKSVRYLRSRSTDAIRERYAISKQALRSEENVKVRYTYQNGVQAWVTYSGHKIPLYRYDGAAPKVPTLDTRQKYSVMIGGKWKKVYPGVNARGHQFVSTSPVPQEGAFVARMKSGHIGIFRRTGGMTSEGSDTIEELMGSSYEQMIGSEPVREKLANEVKDEFGKHLDDEVYKILGGLR